MSSDVFGAPESAYRDRQHAGLVLAEHVTGRQLADPVVLGLARGGVPVATEVAGALNAPVRVTVARKIGAPGQPELALGAVTAEGPATYDERIVRSFRIDQQALEQHCAEERDEARRREQVYEQGDPVALSERDVILVDDGLATGATARAAVRMVRESGPRSIVLACPVGAPDAVLALQQEADVVVCPLQPRAFHAVGQWYRDFHPTSDQEILTLLREAAPG